MTNCSLELTAIRTLRNRNQEMRCRGLLCHISGTIPDITPLKGGVSVPVPDLRTFTIPCRKHYPNRVFLPDDPAGRLSPGKDPYSGSVERNMRLLFPDKRDDGTISNAIIAAMNNITTTREYFRLAICPIFNVHQIFRWIKPFSGRHYADFQNNQTHSCSIAADRRACVPGLCSDLPQGYRGLPHTGQVLPFYRC